MPDRAPFLRRENRPSFLGCSKQALFDELSADNLTEVGSLASASTSGTLTMLSAHSQSRLHPASPPASVAVPSRVRRPRGRTGLTGRGQGHGGLQARAGDQGRRCAQGVGCGRRAIYPVHVLPLLRQIYGVHMCHVVVHQSQCEAGGRTGNGRHCPRNCTRSAVLIRLTRSRVV